MTDRNLIVSEGTEIAVSEHYAEGGVVVAGGEGLHPALAEHWGQLAGQRHATALKAISGAADLVGEEMGALANAFDTQLSEETQLVIIDQLSITLSKHHVRPDADSDSVLEGPAKDYLAAAWGRGERARFKAAIALQQLDHISARLGEAETERALDWFANLHPADQAGIWHALSGG